jgi:hypothetical protein
VPWCFTYQTGRDKWILLAPHACAALPASLICKMSGTAGCLSKLWNEPAGGSLCATNAESVDARVGSDQAPVRGFSTRTDEPPFAANVMKSGEEVRGNSPLVTLEHDALQDRTRQGWH